MDEVAARIQARILTGELPTGSRIRQEGLASEFGISRTPVREALRKLQAAGLVELALHRGAVVRGPSVREIRDAYLVRAELEGMAAELAAGWITDVQLERLHSAEKLFERAVRELVGKRRRGQTLPHDVHSAENSSWMQANDLFHEVVHEAAGNSCLIEVLSSLHKHFPRNLTWTALSADSRLLSENAVQHRLIREAIESRDPAGARSLMTAHVQQAGALIVATFERRLS